MSIDRSLRGQSSLSRHRNVLTRAERVQILTETRDWNQSKSALGLPKIAHRKAKAGRKKAKAAAASSSGGSEQPQ
jgi:small basic protein (TIGR04137 family)